MDRELNSSSEIPCSLSFESVSPYQLENEFSIFALLDRSLNHRNFKDLMTENGQRSRKSLQQVSGELRIGLLDSPPNLESATSDGRKLHDEASPGLVDQ